MTDNTQQARAAVTPEAIEAAALIGEALRRRANNGGMHLHHEGCIHNLAPEDQIEMRGKTVEWWRSLMGAMPEQITPDEWGNRG